LLSKGAAFSGGGFGAEVHEAMEVRINHLIVEGVARLLAQRVVFVRDLGAIIRRGKRVQTQS
jgi:hypothetical protein